MSPNSKNTNNKLNFKIIVTADNNLNLSLKSKLERMLFHQTLITSMRLKIQINRLKDNTSRIISSHACLKSFR